MGLKKVTITPTAANTWTIIPELDNTGWFYLLDVEYTDTDANTLKLRDGSDKERYSYTSTGTVIIDLLEPPYAIKGPIDYIDTDAGGANTVYLTLKDAI